MWYRQLKLIKITDNEDNNKCSKELRLPVVSGSLFCDPMVYFRELQIFHIQKEYFKEDAGNKSLNKFQNISGLAVQCFADSLERTKTERFR